MDVDSVREALFIYRDLVKAVANPPPGFVAIPNSTKGGFHKRSGGSWEYWYPGGPGGSGVRKEPKSEEPRADTKLRGADRVEKVLSRIREAISSGEADLCKIEPVLCRENFGIPRKEMPQLLGQAQEKFLATLQAKGISITRERVAAEDLKATQVEINAGIVGRKVQKIAAGKEQLPILVSKDGFILDGHHTWASKLLLDEKNTLQIKRIDLPIKELLALANAAEGTVRRAFGIVYEGKRRSWVRGQDYGLQNTQEKYKKPDGSYDPERKKLHESIIDKFLSHVPDTPKGKKPVAVLTMGGTAAGKTSLVKAIFGDKHDMAHVDSDAVKEELPEFQKALHLGEYKGKPMSAIDGAFLVHEESADIADEVERRTIAQKKSLVVDGTGKNAAKFIAKVRALRDAGYHVHLLMPDVEHVDDAIERSKERAEESGRYVPEKIARAIHDAIRPNFEKIAPEVDDFALFAAQPKGPPPRLVYRGPPPDTQDPQYLEGFRQRAQKAQAQQSMQKSRGALPEIRGKDDKEPHHPMDEILDRINSYVPEEPDAKPNDIDKDIGIYWPVKEFEEEIREQMEKDIEQHQKDSRETRKSDINDDKSSAALDIAQALPELRKGIRFHSEPAQGPRGGLPPNRVNLQPIDKPYGGKAPSPSHEPDYGGGARAEGIPRPVSYPRKAGAGPAPKGGPGFADTTISRQERRGGRTFGKMNGKPAPTATRLPIRQLPTAEHKEPEGAAGLKQAAAKEDALAARMKKRKKKGLVEGKTMKSDPFADLVKAAKAKSFKDWAKEESEEHGKMHENPFASSDAETEDDDEKGAQKEKRGKEKRGKADKLTGKMTGKQEQRAGQLIPQGSTVRMPISTPPPKSNTEKVIPGMTTVHKPGGPTAKSDPFADLADLVKAAPPVTVTPLGPPKQGPSGPPQVSPSGNFQKFGSSGSGASGKMTGKQNKAGGQVNLGMEGGTFDMPDPTPVHITGAKGEPRAKSPPLRGPRVSSQPAAKMKRMHAKASAALASAKERVALVARDPKFVSPVSADWDSWNAMGAPMGWNAEVNGGFLMLSQANRGQMQDELHKAGAPLQLRAPDPMLSMDEPIDPTTLLAKSEAARVRALYHDEPQMVAPNVDAACIAHGYRDLTKSMNLANTHGRCTCPSA